MMKAILIIAAILALCFCFGWMSYATTDGNASVTLDTEKAKEDTSTALEKGKEIVQEGIEKLKGSAPESTTPAVGDSASKVTPVPQLR
jgi:predicted negative regulator of RcsB-dependent stress response